MSAPGSDVQIRDIVREQALPHAPETVWRALTTPALIARWLRLVPLGFEARVGTRFTFQTEPAGAWDGRIHCEVLSVDAPNHLSFAWRSGHASNQGRYGAPLDTVVTWTLTRIATGTRLRLVHAGFQLPNNVTAFRGMSEGWRAVFSAFDPLLADEQTGDGTR